MKSGITFDDVQLIPQYSETKSRKDVSLKSPLTRYWSINIPLVAAPMDTVCEFDMAFELMRLGGAGFVHRFMSIEQQVKIVEQLFNARRNSDTRQHFLFNTSSIGRIRDKHELEPICMSIGATGDYFERAEALLGAGADILLIDVAHGHHKHVKDALINIGRLKKSYIFDVIAGNIATEYAATELIRWGADALRVGIGGGSVCETRLRTGIGIPQITAINDCAIGSLRHSDEMNDRMVPIIADGGIRYIGDITKAIVAGAQTVMLGSLFAGTNEAPGSIYIAGVWPNTQQYKMYRGSASATQKLEKNGHALHVEGASKMIPSKGPVENIVRDMIDGISSSMSYLGVDNLQSLWRNMGLFVTVTNAGAQEAKPHLL